MQALNRTIATALPLQEEAVHPHPRLKEERINLLIRVRHYNSLPDDFADGLNRPATRQALKRFQGAYGLVTDGIYEQQSAMPHLDPRYYRHFREGGILVRQDISRPQA
ncbi:MAG: peptidoglycan-binding domain-containing protein [Cyanobacteria bacterium MAG CAR3_bin_5]|nr:peptidoglycan-binding domain-containing protein [Cyanobacteria bacterium MAG CAR3_bin_5]